MTAADQANLMPGGGASKNGRHGLLVMFVCAHCPYVKHVEEELARIGVDYEGKIAIAAISSNDVGEYPQDGPEEMKRAGGAAGMAVSLSLRRDAGGGAELWSGLYAGLLLV